MSLEGARSDTTSHAEGCVLDIEDIRAILPHRFPMLLVDRILELDPGKRAVGLKNVTINEPFFNGHFPGQAIMPGVLILEAMAQVAGLMLMTDPIHAGKLTYIGALNRVKMRRVVVPGDTLITEVTALHIRESSGKVRMVARVQGEVAAEGELIFALRKWRDPAPPLEKLAARSEEAEAEGGATGGAQA